MKKKIQNRFLLIFLLALVLRALWFFIVLIKNPSGFMLYDSWGYWRISENIALHGIFSQGNENTLLPDSVRTPVYPLFIYFIFRILGIGFYGIIAVQILVSSAVCSLVSFTGEKIFESEKAGTFAGIFIALDFPSIFFANTLLTETLFSCLLLFAFFFFFSFLINKKKLPLVFSALFSGLAILCRPAAIWVPLIFAGAIFFGRIFQMKGRANVALLHPAGTFLKLKVASLFLLFSFIVVAPWVMRNYLVFGSPVLSTITEINLLFHTAANIKAIKEKEPLFKIQEEYREISGKNFDWSKPGEAIRFARFSRDESLRIIKENPTIFIKNYAGSFFYFFIKPLRNYIDVQLGIESEYESISGVTDQRFSSVFSNTLKKTSAPAIFLTTLQIFFHIILFSFILVFVFSKIKNLNGFVFLILFIILYFALISGITEVDARMRVPIVPFLSLIAGAGAALVFPSKPKT